MKHFKSAIVIAVIALFAACNGTRNSTNSGSSMQNSGTSGTSGSSSMQSSSTGSSSMQNSSSGSDSSGMGNMQHGSTTGSRDSSQLK